MIYDDIFCVVAIIEIYVFPVLSFFMQTFILRSKNVGKGKMKKKM